MLVVWHGAHFWSPKWTWSPISPIPTGHFYHEYITEDYCLSIFKQYNTRCRHKLNVCAYFAATDLVISQESVVRQTQKPNTVHLTVVTNVERWILLYLIWDSEGFGFDKQTKYWDLIQYQIPTAVYGWRQSSPVSPRSSSTRDPALPSRSPLKHSRVSAAARLISSSRIQWPFFTAWAKVPYKGSHQGYTAIKLRSYTPVQELFSQNSLYLTVCYQRIPWQYIFYFNCFTSTNAKTMAASQARICCWVWLSLTASTSQRSCSKAAAQTQEMLVFHCAIVPLSC